MLETDKNFFDQKYIDAPASTPLTRAEAAQKWPSHTKKPEIWDVSPDSMAWRINGESILLLGWARAVLLQLAHPMVAAGVGQHSYFSKSTTARLKRTERTLNKMLEMTFGTADEAWQAAEYIDNIHARIYGKLTETSGPYAQTGMEYSARMVDLLKWVQATFVDSMIKTYEFYIGPLTLAERDQYVKETSVLGPMLGAPEGFFPSSYAELESYMQTMLDSGAIVVSNTARSLAETVLAPLVPLPILDKLVNWYLLLPVNAMLPDFVRKGYGLKWSKFDQQVFKFQVWSFRRLVKPLLPKRVRLLPTALEARKRAALKS